MLILLGKAHDCWVQHKYENCRHQKFSRSVQGGQKLLPVLGGIIRSSGQGLGYIEAKQGNGLQRDQKHVNIWIPSTMKFEYLLRLSLWIAMSWMRLWEATPQPFQMEWNTCTSHFLAWSQFGQILVENFTNSKPVENLTKPERTWCSHLSTTSTKISVMKIQVRGIKN